MKSRFFNQSITLVAIMLRCLTVCYSQSAVEHSASIYSGKIPQHFYDLASGNPSFCMIKGDMTKKYLALTFDDGPSEVSKQVLDILEKYEAKVTFFWLGQNLAKHVDLVNQALENGHVIGNHSWDHSNMIDSSSGILWDDQVETTNELFADLTGQKLSLYRPPFGGVSKDQIDFLGKKGMRTVLWSISTLDWDKNRNSAEEITDRVIDSLSPGLIVLMHDFDAKSNPDAGPTRQSMLDALESIILKSRALGYEFVTINELITEAELSSEKN